MDDSLASQPKVYNGLISARTMTINHQGLSGYLLLHGLRTEPRGVARDQGYALNLVVSAPDNGGRIVCEDLINRAVGYYAGIGYALRKFDEELSSVNLYGEGPSSLSVGVTLFDEGTRAILTVTEINPSAEKPHVFSH